MESKKKSLKSALFFVGVSIAFYLTFTHLKTINTISAWLGTMVVWAAMIFFTMRNFRREEERRIKQAPDARHANHLRGAALFRGNIAYVLAMAMTGIAICLWYWTGWLVINLVDMLPK